MKIEIPDQAVLDAIADNPSGTYEELAKIFIETGWDDLLVKELAKAPSFINELAVLLVEKNMWRELTDEIENVKEDQEMD